MPGRFEYEIREEALFLRQKEGEGVYRIEPWPRLRSMVRLLENSDWIPCPPPVRLLSGPSPAQPVSGRQLEFDLGLAEGLRTDDPVTGETALARFRSALPPMVARGAELFRKLQWEVLVACSLSDRFIDLLSSNPALAYLWLSYGKIRGFCQEGAAEILAAQMSRGGEINQRQLLRSLSLRPTKAALKLLRKCHVPALNSHTEKLLLLTLSDDHRMGRLRHVPCLGRGVLELARCTRVLQACSPALLSEIAGSGDELQRAPTARCLENHLALLDELGMPLPRPFRSRQDLGRQHQTLGEEFPRLQRELEQSVAPPPPPPRPPQAPVRAATPAPAAPPPAQKKRSQARKRTDDSFPPPPLSPGQQIVPITTRRELQAEGRIQSNCVASYFRLIQNGTLFIYRVVSPERCTLSVIKCRDGRWRCGELKTAQNGKPRSETRQVVEAWIESNQTNGPKTSRRTAP